MISASSGNDVVEGPSRQLPRQLTGRKRARCGPGVDQVLTNAAHQQPATVAMPAVVGERFNAAAWLVDRMAAEHPRRTAVTVAAGSAFGSAGASAGASAEDGCDVSYGELAGQVTAAAAALVASGVRAEERVLLCMADGLELMSLFLGALRIGAVPVPVSTMLTAGDLSVLALDSRARLLAVTPVSYTHLRAHET